MALVVLVGLTQATVECPLVLVQGLAVAPVEWATGRVVQTPTHQNCPPVKVVTLTAVLGQILGMQPPWTGDDCKGQKIRGWAALLLIVGQAGLQTTADNPLVPIRREITQ
jgi:hypothetical protein